jgi:hypothetical protein
VKPAQVAAYAAALAPLLGTLCAGGARLEVEFRAPEDRVSPAVVLRWVGKDYGEDESPRWER